MELNSQLMTTAEVAELTRSPQSTVRYWRFCGTGPNAFRVGRRVLYRRHDVEAWLEVQEHADIARRAS
jgi:excisionase family DNA binding protein